MGVRLEYLNGRERKIGCVKTLQNLPFQVAKFCILDAKFEICFCKKPRGQEKITNIERGECSKITVENN